MELAAILEFASSVGIFGLFASFSIAYWRYNRKQEDQREAVKRAIFTELLSTDHLDRAYATLFPDDKEDPSTGVDYNQKEGIPANQFLQTNIGESYSDQFGLLKTEEIEAVTAYYTEAENLREAIRARRMFELSLKESHDIVAAEMGDVVAGEIREVKERRDRVLRMWCSEFDHTLDELMEEDIYVKTAS
ncbi:hypothetical protein [Haloferax prahovense]|nr:hypothetical protein [Haloferax prahovense]